MILLRSILFNLFFFAATFVITLLLATPVRFAAPHRVMGAAQLWARVMVWGARVICGIRLHVSGLEHIGSGAALIASRHQSAFDTFVWLTLMPRCCYVLKRELLRIPLFGPLMPLTGMIAVDRGGGASALRELMREGERAVREERQIVIFPEGTRAEVGAMLPLQPGVAALAARTRLPVIPVVTDSGHCWGRRAFHKRPGTIHIRVLKPIPTGIRRDELMQRLCAALQSSVVENSVG
jgi:1-acyl-sn-glycerol-3-phosphate acyltransferase